MGVEQQFIYVVIIKLSNLNTKMLQYKPQKGKKQVIKKLQKIKVSTRRN